MSEPFISAVVSSAIPSVKAGCPSGLRFMAPGTPTPHDGVVYHSRGMVLVLGDSADAAVAALELLKRAPKLRIALFAPGAGALKDLPANIAAVGGRIVALQGRLGKFTASVRVAADKLEDAGIFSVNSDRCFDLVLDLCREPLLRQDMLPYGYYAPHDDAAALALALDSLPQLMGDFHKPKYFDYRPQLCAHGAMGIAGCTRCLDACDAAAIRSMGEKIEADPYLCQGCAACTLACPTGALGFQNPASNALLGTLNGILAARVDEADAHVLLVLDAATRHLLPAVEIPGVLLFEVSPLAAFSDELWLAALAGGVGALVLSVGPATPAQSRKLIEQKLDEMRTIVACLGGNPAALQLASPMTIDRAMEHINAVAEVVHGAPIKIKPSDEKRARMVALSDIFAQRRARSADPDASQPCALPTGAAFGSVVVDEGKCTVCHACTHLCPTGALNGQIDPVPALYFKESLCVQCDLCRAGCPEKAIALQARFLPNSRAREAMREVASDHLVPCSSCGTPFIGRRKLAMSLALMQEHAGDLPGGIDSLRMCPGCRQRETLIA